MISKFFEKVGINVLLGDDGALRVSGLSSCSTEDADMLREYIRAHKSEIVGELSTARMRECLHGKPCQYLDVVSGGRHLCSKADTPIFDLKACPLNLWEGRPGSGENVPAASRRRKTRIVNESMVATWRRGRHWCLEHLAELNAVGWDRHELLRAGRYKYPMGSWGPAWFWPEGDFTASLEPDGAICWTWKNANGKDVAQAMRPKNPIERKGHEKNEY